MKPIERDFDRRHAILPGFFLVVGIGVAIGMTMMGLDRDHYFFYGEPPPSWSPAFGRLALYLGFTALECAALVWLTLRFRGRALWKAAIVGLMAFAPWTVLHTFTVMHAPGFILMHAAWSMAVCIALAVLAAGEPGRQFDQSLTRRQSRYGWNYRNQQLQS